jgi:hypothetical protein
MFVLSFAWVNDTLETTIKILDRLYSIDMYFNILPQKMHAYVDKSATFFLD